ncbi:hypothetical protein ACJX0J_012269, partial [Zea mays]
HNAALDMNQYYLIIIKHISIPTGRAVVDERSTPDIGKRRILLEKSRFSLVMCSSSPSLLTRKTQVERPWTEFDIKDISGGLTADVHLQTGVLTRCYAVGAINVYKINLDDSIKCVGAICFDRDADLLLEMEPLPSSGKTWALPKCRFFLWLVAHKKCWTTNRLEKELRRIFIDESSPHVPSQE